MIQKVENAISLIIDIILSIVFIISFYLFVYNCIHYNNDNIILCLFFIFFSIIVLAVKKTIEFCN